MITFPNAKINIGLNIINKCPDSYHNIETLFYPITEFFDVLETVDNEDFSVKVFGANIGGNIEDNLIAKAFRLLQTDFNLPNTSFFLKKNIPMGAGLGGGSSDAAFTLKMLNEKFKLDLTVEQLISYASKLGADCAFFIINSPMFAKGKGDILKSANISLAGNYIYIIKPNVHISTAEAYKNCTPKRWETPLFQQIRHPIEQWKNVIFNDFENVIFPLYPQIGKIKQKLYSLGAVYASMSGSGASVYGIFCAEAIKKISNTKNFINCHEFIFPL
jgi:4-diphosphocytidyl-2-C-methyl-D-erythritol kinase